MSQKVELLFAQGFFRSSKVSVSVQWHDRASQQNHLHAIIVEPFDQLLRPSKDLTYMCKLHAGHILLLAKISLAYMVSWWVTIKFNSGSTDMMYSCRVSTVTWSLVLISDNDSIARWSCQPKFGICQSYGIAFAYVIGCVCQNLVPRRLEGGKHAGGTEIGPSWVIILI